MPLFGTSGIRGNAKELFTDRFCFDLGRTFAKFLLKYKQTGYVGVGMDPRESSPRIKHMVMEGIFHEGFLVVDQGVTPVPSMGYLLQIDPGCCGSVMVTGSHIKANLNGVKFFAFKEEILKKHEKEIEEIYMLTKEESAKPKNAEILNSEKALEEYRELLRMISTRLYPSWKVIVDAGDGAQSDTVSQVLKERGVKVVELNASVQGRFMARDTENKEDYKELMEKVVEEKADFGIGFDADGDRVIFVDHLGNFIPGDYTGSLIAKEAWGETVVTPITTSTVVEHIGKKVIRTRVGSPYVVQSMKEHLAKFGFEANGGGISAEIVYTRDGGTTAIKLLNILDKSGKTLEELVGALPKYFLSKTKMDYRWELKDKIMEEVKKEFKGVKVEDLDGLKIWLDEHSWILFRSSANAPEFRIFAESTSEESANTIMQKGADFVRKLIS